MFRVGRTCRLSVGDGLSRSYRLSVAARGSGLSASAVAELSRRLRRDRAVAPCAKAGRPAMSRGGPT